MSIRSDVLVSAGELQQLTEAVGLRITAPSKELPDIANGIATTLLLYADAHGFKPKQPTLAGSMKRMRSIALHVRAVLNLLDVDHRGPDGSLQPYVPVPGWLIADPAPFVPGIDPKTALNSGERRGDEARDAMLAEGGIQLAHPSIFGAHDVARVAVAALRQLAGLADTAAKHAAMVRRTSYDPAVRLLFAELADAFEALHGRRYTVSNTPRHAGSERTSKPGGPGPRWTLALFRHAAEAAAGMPCEPALRQLASRFAKRPDGLAERIREARRRPGKRMHFYRRAGGGIKNRLSSGDF